MITRQGRVEVLNDPECRLFPWHPRPVLELSESNAVQLHEGPCLVLFVGKWSREALLLCDSHVGVTVLLTLRFLPRLRSDAEEEGELEPAKELIQPIAEKLMAKYKAKEEETPLLFFVAGEVRRDATQNLREPKCDCWIAAPLIVLLLKGIITERNHTAGLQRAV